MITWIHKTLILRELTFLGLTLKIFVAFVIVPIFIFGARPVYADFVLEPGDTVSISLTGLNNLSFDAEVDAKGEVDMNWLGRFKAQGFSADELEQIVRTDAAGKIVKQYDLNGEIYIIQLDGDEIEIKRNGYRTIIVGGDVARTGQIQYHPGITVRGAVSLSGGVRSRLLTDDASIDPIQLLRWQTAYGQAALQHARAIVTIWRVNSELQQDMEATIPNSDGIFVSRNVFDELVAEQNRVRKLNHDNENDQRQYFKDSEEQATQRIEILEQQKIELKKALTSDEIEEARVVNLVERGLTPGSRLADTRRTTVLSATRLLDVEEDLSTTRLVLIRLKRERELFEHERKARLLEQRRESKQSARNSTLEMNTISKYLAGASNEIGTENLIQDIDYTTTIYRYQDGQLTSHNATKSTQLLPGDSIEISVREIILEDALTE